MNTFSFCPNCGNRLDTTDAFCKHCGNAVSPNGVPNNDCNINRNSNYTNGEKQSIYDRLNDYVGNTGPKELNWKDLFTDVFKSHTADEAESIFICGTKNTTPPLSQVSSTWPKPWLYSRVFLVFAIAFILLKICWDCFGNVNVVPRLIMVGARYDRCERS